MTAYLLCFFFLKYGKLWLELSAQRHVPTSSCDPALLCLYVLRILGNEETDFFCKETGK